VVDETVFFEALQRRAHAPLGDVDTVDDLPLAERLVSVLEKKAIHYTLGGVRREVGERWLVLVDGPKLVFRDRHCDY